MNTSPANLNPAASVQTQPASGKTQDSEADTPFSQVLSSEMAQNRRNSEPAKSEKAGKAEKTEKADTGTDEITAAVGQQNAGASPAEKSDSVQIEATFDMLRADALPASPDGLLALATPPSLPPAESVQVDDAASENAAAQVGDPLSGHDSRKGASKALLAAQLDDAAAGSNKPDASQGSKTNTGFSGQLAAAQQSDSAKSSGTLSDLMAQSILRAAPPAVAEAPTPTSGASANRLAPSVGTTAWGQALGEKVVWMAAGAQQTASLTLNPPNLGPLQIVLNISNEQATANFFSAQPEVRQALEAAFPRLREMMNDAGIQLGQATVSAETPQQHAFEQQQARASMPFSGENDPAGVEMPVLQSPVQRAGRGLVDTFA